MSAQRAKKKRSPRQAWRAAERAEKRAIAKAVVEASDAREPTWIDRRGDAGHAPELPMPGLRFRVPLKRLH